MYIDPTPYTTRPTDDRIPQELAIYDRLEELNIPYVRVDHDHADTIEICHQVEEILEGKICKNLFLCNRQQTEFYLLMMPAKSRLHRHHQHHVQLVIDRELMDDEFISGHPGISTSTLRLKREDMLKFVSSTGHEPIYIDLPDPRNEE